MNNEPQNKSVAHSEVAELWAAIRGWVETPKPFWVTRFIILRLLGLIYFVAFLVAAQQIVPLVGHHGLLPADSFLGRVAAHYSGSMIDGFLQMPCIFWFNVSDGFLLTMAWLGVVLSFVVVCGFANAPMLGVLWALYMSFVHIGQDWYSYGWEIQIQETGFLAMFLCPLLDARPFPKRPVPAPVIWLFRWLGFRIMLGAGLIKLRGDACWWDLTCLDQHYETQPIPNPLSPWFHHHPHWLHAFQLLWNHFVELVVPWFMFGPRRARHLAGLLLVSFQGTLILSGNLSFLNWLTTVPMLACFDDTLLLRVFPRLRARVAHVAKIALPSLAQKVCALSLFALVAVLSISPVMNLLSNRQAMNTSFDRLNLVNTYGAFGSVGKERGEIIFEGTDDVILSPQTVWREYEFKAKPGNPLRPHPIIAPYQPHLDWQIWFAAMSDYQHYPWTLHFVWKLLHNDEGTLSLIAHNPFPGAPPRFIRASFYKYEFARPGDPPGARWHRERLGEWLPPLSVDMPEFRAALAQFGWLPAEQVR